MSLASLAFVLFQGGKLSMAVFMIVSVLCGYLLLGRWSGITQAAGQRSLGLADETAGRTGGRASAAGAASETKVPTLEAGATLSVRVQVRIPGLWPIPYVLIRDRLIRRGGKEMVFEASFIPDWRRQGEVVYKTPPLRRGFYQFGATDCSTEDIFGLFEHKGTLDLPLSFAVLPRTTTIREWRQLHQFARGSQHHAATTRSQRETTQINGVREYIYGDRLSRVHWNATAKTGTWKSKEFEREALPKTLLILDRRTASYRSSEDFELAVSIVASLFQYAAKRDLAVGLLSVGQSAVYFEPRRRAAVNGEVWEHLIEAEADGNRAPIDAVKDLARHWVPGSFVAVVSPVTSDDSFGLLRWLEERQMNPCHLGLAGRATAAELERWQRRLGAAGLPGYGIADLDELSSVLGGKTG